MRRRGALTLMLAGTMLAGCATAPLPPTKAVQDVKSLVGKWEGTVTTPAARYGYMITFMEDGSWQGMTSAPIDGLTRFEGSIFVRGGKIFFLSRTTGRSLTFALHEGEGQRVLVGRSDDGSITVKLTPAK